MKTRLPGIESLESRQLMAADTLADMVPDVHEASDTLPANQFYLRQDAHGGDTAASDLCCYDTFESFRTLTR